MRGTKAKAKRDVAAEVTARIVAALEDGVAPWVKPWRACGNVPVNAATGRKYNGVNVVLLYLTTMERNYPTMRFLTYNQAKAHGGQVRRGEKGTMVTLWKPWSKTETGADGTETKRGGLLLRHFTVFNVAQVDGLPAEIAEAPTVAVLSEEERHAGADAFFGALGSNVVEGGDVACYIPSLDTIRMPVFSQFQDAASYYSTLAHEHVHWTGAKARTDRAEAFGGRFGSESYAYEELVAELGSAFLCAELGIDGALQHPEYIGHWIKVLKGNDRAIFTAASKAKEAVSFLMAAAGNVAEGFDEEADEAGE